MSAVLVNETGKGLTCTGRELREMFSAATGRLDRKADMINALNVFPVPDGDTGTNMLLTMHSIMAEAAACLDNDASAVANAMARGALMGARGNSGVILSQMMTGLAKGFADQAAFGPAEMARALDQASRTAYEGISRPQEGTMLTVMKDVAAAARDSVARDGQDLLALMETVVGEARRSVARTPELLDVLREAGVVDAGGQGVATILEGILYYLRGQDEQSDPGGDEELATVKEAPVTRRPVFAAPASAPVEEKAYGYCTEFIIRGSELNLGQIRRWVESQGESVLVVGDEGTAKVHVHTTHPGTVIEFAISLGTVHGLKVENMDDQHEEFRQTRRAPLPASAVSVVAVVAGAGLENVFRSLGTAAVVSGGQTMNPSCADILKAIDSVPSNEVIVLPNNKNIILAARQAATATKKKVEVLPTRSIPHGLSALVGFNCESGLDVNVKEMMTAQERVRSVEITTAVRDSRIGTLRIRKGDHIGLIDGTVKVASGSLNEAVFSAMQAVNAGEAEIASLFYGDQVDGDEAASLGRVLGEHYPGLELEVIPGGQPHYAYIISVEH